MLNEVAPPGWGHTKAEKEKTKPDKPKSKIGGSAAAFKRALDDGRFKGLPGDKTKKEKTASMFKLMWAMKKKGAKPHYKPGTDKKFKKYQEESVQNGKVDLTLKTDVNNVLKQDNKEYDRGLLAQVNKDGSYDVAYWYDKYKAYPVEVEIDGKTCAKDAKNIHIKFHPELKKEEVSRRNKPSAIKKKKTLEKLLIDKEVSKIQKEDWKPEIEHSKLGDAVKKKREKKRKEAEASLPPHLRLDVMKKAFASTNEETSMPNVEKKDRGAIKKRFKGLFKKDIKGTVQGVNEGDLHNKMDTFKSKAVKRRDDNALGTISSATKRYELLKKLIGSKKKHDKPAIKK